MYFLDSRSFVESLLGKLSTPKVFLYNKMPFNSATRGCALHEGWSLTPNKKNNATRTSNTNNKERKSKRKQERKKERGRDPTPLQIVEISSLADLQMLCCTVPRQSLRNLWKSYRSTTTTSPCNSSMLNTFLAHCFLVFYISQSRGLNFSQVFLAAWALEGAQAQTWGCRHLLQHYDTH